LDIRHFSPSQREVVEAGDGPLSILAGPGSGKTTVLAGRIAYLVEQRGVAATTILAITFATAAAATLRQRLAGVLGDAAQDLTITTFHALGLRLIKQWSGELGFRGGVPAVYGRDDARLLLREVASGFGLEVAADGRGRDMDPWALSLSKLTFALDRFRLGWIDCGRNSNEQDDVDEELLRL
jgi:DNA helicase-2/ATP-dependent DNA helicase PcrA